VYKYRIFDRVKRVRPLAFRGGRVFEQAKILYRQSDQVGHIHEEIDFVCLKSAARRGSYAEYTQRSVLPG
jgi:hypothetical protein